LLADRTRLNGLGDPQRLIVLGCRPVPILGRGAVQDHASGLGNAGQPG